MDPRDQTFMTIHNLTPDANILFASDSILDILGYQPDEVKGQSAFDYFHPEEVPFARSVHSRGVLLDKAAVLHYARVLSKTGQWMSCECCFTVVHNVLVASTSIYFKGERSERRARDAPQIRRIFSSSPRDPRYRMLEHLSPKFKMPPMEREPRAALILNRFTRNLTIMYATDAVTQILGLRPGELLERPFYECIQPNCIDEAEKCLESAKANESIAYLRFWFKDPRIDLNNARGQEEEEAEEMDDEGDDRNGSAALSELDVKGPQPRDGMDIDELPVPRNQGAYGAGNGGRGEDGDASRRDAHPSRQCGRRPEAPQTFELEAVVSCTSDGLVVVLRRARPPIPDPQPPVAPAAFKFENGLFAAPWGLQPIEPYISPELLYTFRPPLLPQYMPLRECVKAAGGPPLDQLMRSIRDVAVFAWAVTGINGNLASYGQGRPRKGAQPADGLPVWESNSGPNPYPDHPQAAAARSEAPKEPLGGAGAGSVHGHGSAAYQSGEAPSQGYPRTRHASLDEGMYDTRQPLWPPASAAAASAATARYQYNTGNGGYEPPPGQYRRPLRPAFSYDALQDHARHQQASAGYGPSSQSSLSGAAASRRCANGFREDIWGAEAPSPRSCIPSYGPHSSSRGSSARDSSKSSGYFWQ